MKRFSFSKVAGSLALATMFLFFGCSKDIQTKEAVLQGVMGHLTKRGDIPVANMKIEISSVSFRGNEADATVSFAPKGTEGGGMQMRYTLEKKGNEWIVKGKADSGNPHGAAAPAPGGMPPSSGLPPDHPPMGSALGSGSGSGTKK